MTAVPQPSRRSLVRSAFELIFGSGGRIGSTVYGTLAVLATLTAAYAAEKHHPWGLVELVVTSFVVFWITYVYAHALSHSIEERRHLSRAILVRVAGSELGLLFSAIGPVLFLLLGAVGLISENVSIWLALAAGLLVLMVEGVRYAYGTEMGYLGTAAILIVNLVLGLCIVALKLTLVH